MGSEWRVYLLSRIHIYTWMLNKACGNERNVDEVAEEQQTAFVYAANIRWTAERYPFWVGTSKKNTFAMLGIRLTRRMPNKPIFVHMGHSFGFASVSHASFAFAYRCGPGSTYSLCHTHRHLWSSYTKKFKIVLCARKLMFLEHKWRHLHWIFITRCDYYNKLLHQHLSVRVEGY